MTQTKPVLLAIYGEGGHQSEMASLIKYLSSADDAFEIVSLGSGQLAESVLDHYSIKDVRSKHSRLQSLVLFIPILFVHLYTLLKIIRRYKIRGVISTGPGLCVMPMLVCRLLGIKTVFVETYCRFTTRSMTGRVMSKVANRFLVQNEELKSLYPNAEYCGRL